MKGLVLNFIYFVKYWFWNLVLDELEMKLANNRINYCDYLDAKKYIGWKMEKLK